MSRKFNKVIVVMPAYNAERTLEKTFRDIDEKLGGRLLAHVDIVRQPQQPVKFVILERDKDIVDSLLREAESQGLIPEKYTILYGAQPEPTDAEPRRQLYLRRPLVENEPAILIL